MTGYQQYILILKKYLEKIKPDRTFFRYTPNAGTIYRAVLAPRQGYTLLLYQKNESLN